MRGHLRSSLITIKHDTLDATGLTEANFIDQASDKLGAHENFNRACQYLLIVASSVLCSQEF